MTRIASQHVTRIPELLTVGNRADTESTTDWVTSEDTEASKGKGKEPDLSAVAMVMEMSPPPMLPEPMTALDSPRETNLAARTSDIEHANVAAGEERPAVEASGTGQTADKEEKGVNPLTVARAYTSGIILLSSTATLIAYCLDGGGVAREEFLGILISAMTLSGIVLAKCSYDLVGQIRDP
jgi:hypothetical protein